MKGSAEPVQIGDGVDKTSRPVLSAFGYGSGLGGVHVGIFFFARVRVEDAGDPSENIIGIGGDITVFVFKGQGFAVPIVDRGVFTHMLINPGDGFCGFYRIDVGQGVVIKSSNIAHGVCDTVDVAVNIIPVGGDGVRAGQVDGSF